MYCIWLLMCCNVTLSQSLRYNIAQPYISLSAYSTEQKNPLSFTSNQAALASIKSAGAGVYAEQRFLLAATSAYTAAIALPTNLGNFGLQLNYAGFSNFNENKIGIAYAKKLGKAIDLGVQFNHYSYQIPGYNTASTIFFEIGTIIHLTDKLIGGFHIYNPIGGRLSKTEDDKLSSVYKFGLGYDASENFNISTEIIKEENKTVNIVAGFQYHFAKQFFLGGGFISQTSSPYAGAGIGWKNLRLDVSASYHSQLGFSPGILLVINFESKKK